MKQAESASDSTASTGIKLDLKENVMIKKLINCLEKIQDFESREIKEDIEYYDTVFVDLDRVLDVIFDLGYCKIRLAAEQNSVISSLLENCIVPLAHYIASGYPAPRRVLLKRRSSAEFLLKLLENSKIEEKRRTYLIDNLKKSIVEFHKDLKETIEALESDSDSEDSDNEDICFLSNELKHTWWKKL